MDETLTEEEIVSLLREQADAADRFYNTDLADRQANALDFYDSEPFGDEEEGRSQYIEPVVEQTIDDMTVDLMEAFVSGDRVVELEANDEASEEAAAQATEAIHYLFMRKQRGYRITLDWLQSGLVETLGVVKVVCVEQITPAKVETIQRIVTPEELAVYEVDEYKSATDNGDGTYTLNIEFESRPASKTKRYEVMPIPSEEFMFSPRMKAMDDKVYKAHVCEKTISDLIAMGFDRDTVEALPTDGDNHDMDSRQNARWRDENWTDTERKGAMRKVMLREEYDYIDRDGDGIAELVRAFRVDNTLLKIEDWDEQPFVGFCPYPRAHRMVGKGLAEKVMPDQRVESVITRQMLDGLYASNAPRRWLPEESIGDTTIDDLLNVRPNAIIRGRGLTAPANLSENFDLSKSLTVLQRFSDRRQNRTGLTDLGRGMDKNAMNDTASGQAQLMAAGEKQIRYVARNFGEAMAEMFLKLMRLVKAHGEPMTIKIGSKFEQIDPSQWPEEMDFSIRVGLGTNGKDKRIAYRMTIAQLQSEALIGGTGLVEAKHLYNTGQGLIRDMGLGEPSDFFADPDAEPEIDPNTGEPIQKEEKPDAEMLAMQAEQQMQQAKMQAEQELAQAKLQMAQQEAQMKLQLQREQAEQEADLAERKAQFEATQAEQKMAQEFALAQQRMQMEEKLGAMKEAALSKNREGGDLDK